MMRKELFEFEDQNRFPKPICAGVTNFKTFPELAEHVFYSFG